MRNWKSMLRRILYPGKFITFLTSLAGFGLLGAVFYWDVEENPLVYAVYLLAFYALVLLTAASIPLIRNVRALARRRSLHAMQQLRGRLMLSLSINICFGGYNLISGAIYRSVWLISTGVYYMVLSLIRMVLVYYEKKQKEQQDEIQSARIGWQGFQVCGILMVLLNIAMSGMVIQMIHHGRGSQYPELVVYAVASFTFYRLTAAIIRVVQSKENRDPIRGAARNINLTAAIMSLYSLQTAMLNVFGDDPEFQLRMNGISGSGVCILVVLGALGMAIHGGKRKREVNYIPVRFLLAIALAVLETVTIVAIVMLLSYYVPYFYLAVWATEIACVIRIIASEDNPDYKIPWLLLVLIVPVAGFMLYFLFYDRKLHKRYLKRLEYLKAMGYKPEDTGLLEKLKEQSPAAHSQARMLCKIGETHLYSGTKQEYFPLGENMHRRLLEDLRGAEKFIFLEYFIIEEGIFWNSVLDILKEKAAQGVEIKVVYDDIGCMMTLPGDYARQLRKLGIEAYPFSALKGNADSEFNNRSHRKITVIDGKVGYTGGVNLADEYINEVVRFGHWKDTAIRLEGDAVKELTNLFLIDYGLNSFRQLQVRQDSFPECTVEEEGFLIPFGDCPNPIYKREVGKSVIQNMLNQANSYVYMMSPYLIVDNELRQAIEDAALRGVNVKLILPHIPDKKLVYEMARSHYQRLMDAGVEIYEYEPGFVHAKVYLADDEYAMVGTINLDYRSLVHNFENGVWMYRCDCLKDIKQDFADTLEKCIRIDQSKIKWSLMQRFIRSVVKVFTPMM